MENRLAMDLQYFAEGGDTTGSTGTQDSAGNGQQQNNQNQHAPSFDYEKLASIISGKQTVAEDTVLKNFFKQQGLSQEEMNQAIRAFKEEKAKNTPDVGRIQTELTETQALAKQVTIEKEAILEAVTLGLDSKTIPYILKLADLSSVMGEDGKINKEDLKNALNKVLEDVPQLNPSQQQNNGFQIGNSNQQNNNNNNNATNDELKAAFGL